MFPRIPVGFFCSIVPPSKTRGQGLSGDANSQAQKVHMVIKSVRCATFETETSFLCQEGHPVPSGKTETANAFFSIA